MLVKSGGLKSLALFLPQQRTALGRDNMNDTRQVGLYFKEREKVKELMKEMLQPKYEWTREVKSKFEKSWKDYCKAYDEHEKRCKEQR